MSDTAGGERPGIMGVNSRKFQQGEPETDIYRYPQEGHRTRINTGAEITSAGQVQMASHGPRKLDLMIGKSGCSHVRCDIHVLMVSMKYGIDRVVVL